MKGNQEKNKRKSVLQFFKFLVNNKIVSLRNHQKLDDFNMELSISNLLLQQFTSLVLLGKNRQIKKWPSCTRKKKFSTFFSYSKIIQNNRSAKSTSFDLVSFFWKKISTNPKNECQGYFLLFVPGAKISSHIFFAKFQPWDKMISSKINKKSPTPQAGKLQLILTSVPLMSWWWRHRRNYRGTFSSKGFGCFGGPQ